MKGIAKSHKLIVMGQFRPKDPLYQNIDSLYKVIGLRAIDLPVNSTSFVNGIKHVCCINMISVD